MQVVYSNTANVRQYFGYDFRKCLNFLEILPILKIPKVEKVRDVTTRDGMILSH